jgi:hypothetical protein
MLWDVASFGPMNVHFLHPNHLLLGHIRMVYYCTSGAWGIAIGV